METRIYEEAPLKIAVRVCLGIVAFFIVAGIFVSFLPSRPMTSNEKWGGAFGIGLALAVMFGTLLMAWLVLKKRTIIVDYKGVEVLAKRPFGQAETAQFLWQNVTAVDVESQSATVRNSTITSYKLSVIANGQRIYLMDKTFADLNFRNLLRDVNEATKAHLNYVWESCRADETRPILDSTPPFCKISLKPQTVSDKEVQGFTTTVSNPAVPKLVTKKQTRKNASIWLVMGLVSVLGVVGFAYWDYREQVKSYNFWERGSGLDFKTGKPIPNYQPPPFEYRYDRMIFLPYIIIFGGVSLLFLVAGAHEFRKSQKMVETPKMIEADAERERIENLPEVKRAGRIDLILQLLPFAVLVPVPFIAAYGLGAKVFAIYIFFAAVVVGAAYYLAPRWMSRGN